MAITPVTKIRTGNQDIDRIGDALVDLRNWLGSKEIVDGVLIADQALVTGANGNTITHKLGRDYKGYLIVRRSDYTLTHRDQASLVDTSLFINIRASVACTVTLWVF